MAGTKEGGGELNSSNGAPGKCPPECKKELSHINQKIEEIIEMERTQWEEIAKRPKLAPLLWITGLAVAVLGSLLGLIFGQAQKTHEDVVDVMLQTERIEVQLESHMENSRDRYERSNRTGPHGG